MLTLEPDKRFVDNATPQQVFKVGSRITFGKEKEIQCGVITWIGTLPGCDEKHVKVETVSCIIQKDLKCRNYIYIKNNICIV